MIVLGYAWLAGAFDQPGDAQVCLATESGYLVSGSGADAEGVRDPQWKYTRDNQLSLGKTVEHRWSTSDQKSKTALLIMDLPDTSPWSSLVAEFARRTTLGRGATGTADVFCERCFWQPTDSSEAPTVRATFTLPSGREYLVRNVADVPDVELLRRVRPKGTTVGLTGPFGSGKSTVAVAAHGDSLVSLKCFDGMSREDVLGGWFPVPNRPGEFDWFDGPLLVAMSGGRPLLIDDVGWMPAGLQALLLPVFDDTRAIEVLDRPHTTLVTAQPGFSAVITLNPGVGFGLSGPLHDRIGMMVEIPVDLGAAADMAIPPPFVAVANALRRKQVESGDDTRWVPSMRVLLHAAEIADEFGLDFAAAALVSKCPADQQQDVVDEVRIFTDVVGPLRSEVSKVHG